MKKIIFLFLLSTLGFACAKAQSEAVPFTMAQRYFVKNNYAEKNYLQLLKIIDEEHFDRIFGMTPLMGEGNQPTAIDFSTHFVIALIDDTNNTTESLEVKSLTKSGDRLRLEYQINKLKEPSSAFFRFCSLIVVDRHYLAEVTGRMFVEDSDFLVGDDLDDKGCKPSTGHSWSIIEDKCIQLWSTKYVLEGDLNYALLFDKDQTKAEIIGLAISNPTYKLNTILQRTKGSQWKNEELTLIEIKKDHFILKANNKEIAKGKIRE